MKPLMLLVAGALAACACGGSGGRDPSEADESPELSTVELKLSAQPGLAGKYLRIEAVRRTASSAEPVPADSKYPCRSSLAPVCIPIGQAGAVSQQLEDLCPSTNLPMSMWRFELLVFSDPACAPGSMITGDNFACYDSSNLAGLRDPNVSWKLLVPGCNPNNVICIARSSADYSEVQRLR